jgi:hypothetical protein
MPVLEVDGSTLANVGESEPREPRALVLRVGLLEQEGKTSFCLIKDISCSGIRAKIYSSGFAAGPVKVRIADEDVRGAQIVWVADGHAGINFDRRVSRETVRRLNSKRGSSGRRSIPRIAAAARGLVKMDGRNMPAELCDISSFGAKIRTKKDLAPNRPAIVEVPDLPPIAAYVRWSDSGESGLVFATPIPMQVIGHWIDGRLRVRV